MRIAILCNQFPATSETFIADHVTGLLNRGHDVIILPRSRGRAASPLDIDPARIIGRYDTRPMFTAFTQRLRGLNLLRYGRRIRRLPRQAAVIAGLPAFDLVHAHFGPHGVDAADLASLGHFARAPIVTSFHGYDVNVIPGKYGAAFYRRLFCVGARFLANSPFTRQRLIDLGAPSDRTLLHRIGVNLARFTPPDQPMPLRTPPRLLSVARLVDVKGIEFAIRAVALLRDQGTTVHYTIVGEGPLESSLRQLTSELRLDDHITFRGAVGHDHLPDLYRDADIFLMPGIIAPNGAQEAMGLVLIEAQASGVPVIATTVGGMPDSLVPGETGLLVPPADPAALADAVSTLIGHPDRAALARHARSFAETHFDQNILLNQLVDIYHTLVADP